MPHTPQNVAALLPPIPLYRMILRLHRTLPPQMRSLGDDYLKSEFRRHKDITNPVHIVGFLTQWQEYAVSLNAGAVGKKLSAEKVEKLSDEQIGQLWELRKEVEKTIGKEVTDRDIEQK